MKEHDYWSLCTVDEPQKKSKVKAGMKKAKRDAKSLKPLLASVLQARLNDGPQISRQRIDIWSYKQADSEPEPDRGL